MADNQGPWNAFDLFGREFPWPAARVTREPDRTVGESQWIPSVDILERDNAYDVQVDVPGVDPEKITVSVDGNRLSIHGTREADSNVEGQSYRRRERSVGTFFRQFTLPENCDPGEVRATSNNGVLSVTIPKVAEATPRQITVEAL